MTVTQEAKPYALSREEGEPLWMLGGLITLKATGESTDGRLTLMEALAPPGFAVPPHTHEREHEAFYVLEGEMTFYLDEDAIQASEGAFFSIPQGRRTASRSARRLASSTCGRPAASRGSSARRESRRRPGRSRRPLRPTSPSSSTPPPGSG